MLLAFVYNKSEFIFNTILRITDAIAFIKTVIKLLYMI